MVEFHSGCNLHDYNKGKNLRIFEKKNFCFTFHKFHWAYLAADLPIQYADHWSTLPTALLTAMAALSDKEWSLNVWNNIVVNNVNTGAVDPVVKIIVKYTHNSISRKKNCKYSGRFWHTCIYFGFNNCIDCITDLWK